MPAKRRSGQLVPMDQQTDTGGQLHDIAPRTARERLFEPAPEQIPGQLGLELEGSQELESGAAGPPTPALRNEGTER